MGAVLPSLLGSVYYSCGEILDGKSCCRYTWVCIHVYSFSTLKTWKKWPEIDIHLEQIHCNTVKSLQNFAGKLQQVCSKPSFTNVTRTSPGVVSASALFWPWSWGFLLVLAAFWGVQGISSSKSRSLTWKTEEEKWERISLSGLESSLPLLSEWWPLSAERLPKKTPSFHSGCRPEKKTWCWPLCLLLPLFLWSSLTRLWRPRKAIG